MLHMVCPNLKVIQINGNFFRRLALICSRTPHGVRGLKSDSKSETFIKSHGRTPHGVRGLKLSLNRRSLQSLMSHSAWSAWIEIKTHLKNSLNVSCRTPHGVRGLK